MMTLPATLTDVFPTTTPPRPCAGYGGSGTAFGDVWVLHLGDAAGTSPAAFRWEEIKVGLPAPAPRFDHSCCAIPTAANSQQPDKLLLLGGRDSQQHFTDGWLLDLSTWTWQTGAGVPAMGGQVRCGDVRLHNGGHVIQLMHVISGLPCDQPS